MAKKIAKKPASITKVKLSAKPVSKQSAFSRYVEKRNFKSLSVGTVTAELLGTFALVLVYMTVQGSQLYLFFAYTALVLVFARLAGPHLNPAISLGLWAVRRVSGIRTVTFIIAQIIGAMLAVVAANALVPDAVNQLTGQPEAGKVFTAAVLPTASEDLWRILTVEALGMLIFSVGAASAYLTNRSLLTKAFTVGGAYMVGLLLIQGGQILNPAIALSVQALEMEVWPLAIYVLTPISVAIVGMSLFRLVQQEGDDFEADTAVASKKIKV